MAANRIGADVLLLNTSFAGPALAEVVHREGVDRSSMTRSSPTRWTGRWRKRRTPPALSPGTEHPENHDRTVEKLIAAHAGERPATANRKGKLILLTSGTTGTPKGAARSGGGPGELQAMLDRVPWRAEETIVVVAPMFHAWGFSQLVFAASLSCTVVTRRKFDPEATLELIDRHQATGLCVVPVIFGDHGIA